MSYRIQHLKLGGILDQAIAIVKNNFGLLFGILLFAWVPYSLIAGAINLAIAPQLPPNPTMQDVSRFQAEAVENLPITLAIGLFGGLIILPLTNAAIIYAVAERYLGKSITARQAISKGLSKIVPLVGTSILMGLAIMGGLLLCVIPGILFALWFGLAQHVVVLEDVSGTTALGRSKQLVRPYLGTFLALGLVVFIIAFLLGMGVAFVPSPPVSMVVGIIINAAVTMFSAAAFVVYYFSCRCGLENFDLEHLAASVGESRPVEVDELGYDSE